MMRDRKNRWKGRVSNVVVAHVAAVAIVTAGVAVAATHAVNRCQDQAVSSKNRQASEKSIYMAFFMLP
jgi:hypothetical protein